MASSGKPYRLLDYKACMYAAVLVSLSPFQYGIDFGLIGGLQAMPGFLQVYGYRDPTSPIGWNIGTTAQQLISSLMTLGAFISSCCAGPIAHYLGRKQSLWAACLLCVIGNILMMATTHIGALYVGRLVLGLGNGLWMTFSQLYLQETAPARYRGLALSTFQFWTSAGTLIGTIVDNFTTKLGGRESYLIPLGLIYIVPAIQTVLLFTIPESPRWLLAQGKAEQASKALAWLRPKGDPTVETEIAEITAAIEAEKAMAQGVAISDMWANPIDRRRTVLAVCAVTLQAASGAMFMIAYGTYFFEMANVGNAFENSCILVAVGVVAIICNSLVVTRYGRRRVFLISGLVLCGVAQLIVAAVYDAAPNASYTGKVMVAISVVYIFGYNGAISTYAWVSGGELPSQRLRSYTFGLAAAVGFFGAWLTTFTAPYFINPASLGWGPKYGYIWVPSCAIAALWVFFFLPEVKDRTLEEIDEMFEAKVPARKFRGYRCIGRTHLHADEVKKDEESEREIVFGNEKAVAEATVAIG